MKYLYVDSGEEIPPNAPNPGGKPVQVNCFVNPDHAGDIATWRYQTGIILYCNPAPIIWYPKRQNTAESSALGHNFQHCKSRRI